MNDDYIQHSREEMLRSYILSKMLLGAGYAAVGFFGLLLFFWGLAFIGTLLPEESRQTPDPMPRSSIEAPADPTRAVV
jgi:hypothetical protein